MQTHFTKAQLEDPQIREADAILRKCVHCGFCTATCPTYVLTGDERDSPRGRIWLMRELLESPETVSADTGFHLDRCLGCQSCMTTCPSGVDYAHLLDIGRARMETVSKRSVADRLMRRLLAMVIPHAERFHLMMRLGGGARLLAPILPASMKAALKKMPERVGRLDKIGSKTVTFAARSQSGRRVILLAGCAQRALDPEINASTVRVLGKLGVDVTVRSESYCCGALAHHIGEGDAAHEAMRANLLAWRQELEAGDIDAIITNASGCGTMVKDYGHLAAGDPELADIAATISAMTRDITEYLAELPLETIIEDTEGGRGPVTYHSACSLQHGQSVHDLPMQLLRLAGFEVRQPLEPHLCCGSAGVYNILQPEMADKLKARKLENLEKAGAPWIAAGNIGCIQQLGDALPVRHTIRFIDWASGGPPPDDAV
ncbi:MAG: glycolate oxidase subunit GlcF [Alphaproteobacteria bacterium]|nr:glycolate oxidase subunit GlcF [Alphaproteobacteria bacterium]